MTDKNFGCPKFDISCKAIMDFGNGIRKVDGEMHIGKDPDLKTRLFNCGSSLF
jgi:hypothetical protein